MSNPLHCLRVSFLLLAAAPALASGAPQTAIEAASPVAPSQGPFASPRDTLITFQRAITAWKNERDSDEREIAKSCLDVRHLGLREGDYAAGRTADDLDFVLDRVVVFRPEDWADPSALGSAQSWSRTLIDERHPRQAFELAFTRLDDGRWVFARSVVDSVSDWWSIVQEWPRKSGVDKRLTLSERVRSRVPVRFQQVRFWLEDWQWLSLVFLILAGWALKIVVALLFRRGIAHMGRADEIKLDRELLVSFERPLTLFITALVIARGLVLLDLEPAAYGVLFLAASLVLDVAAVWAAFRLIDVISSFLAERAALTANKFDDVLVPLLRRTLKILVVAVGVLYLATLITDDVTGLVAGISIGTLALGFAAKDSIENLFGTFTVLLDKPFQLGDLIKVDGLEGTVESVGFRSTKLRTAEDSLVNVPNSKFIAATVDNLGARRHRRIRASLSLACDTPPAKIEGFCEGVRELLRQDPLVRQDNVEVWLNQLAASSLEVVVQCYVEAPDFRSEAEERHRLFTDVLRLGERLEVEFAFPTQTLLLRRSAGLDHGGTPDSIDAARYLGRNLGGELGQAAQARTTKRTDATSS